jgi:hypothetical protein
MCEVCNFARKKRKDGRFMRRILLIVAMLLLATAPAMATVTVRAMQNGPSNALGQYTTSGRNCNILDVNYTCDASEKVRAFALEITLDNGFVFSSIQDFKRGESNSTSPGYGIFPGSFRDNIDPGAVDWQDVNYSPIAPPSDTDAAGTGIGTNKVILEMGSLYVDDTNKPASAGTLCRLVIDPNRACTPADCNLTIAVNTTRGGVVLEDGSAPASLSLVAQGVVAAGKFSLPDTFPCWEPYRLQYNEWLSVWKPNCWSGQCAATDPNGLRRYQCYGDADAKTEGSLTKYRVYQSDYNVLKAAWGKKATSLMSVPNGFCADFDHKYEGSLTKYRVYQSDYNKLVAYWGTKDTQLKPWCPLP